LGMLTLGLALRGVVQDPAGPRWSAVMVLAVSLQAAGLAGWQRREGWAFCAGLGVNLAASFLAWDTFAGVEFDDWWPRLFQINLACAGMVGLVWLMLARSGSRGTLDSTRTPLLNVQILLALSGNAALLIGAGGLLVSSPAALDPLVGQAGHLWGWI